MVFIASLLCALLIKDSVKNKPASLLVVSLGKTLNGMSPSLNGRKVVEPSSFLIAVAKSNRRLGKMAEKLIITC